MLTLFSCHQHILNTVGLFSNVGLVPEKPLSYNEGRYKTLPLLRYIKKVDLWKNYFQNDYRIFVLYFNFFH